MSNDRKQQTPSEGVGKTIKESSGDHSHREWKVIGVATIADTDLRTIPIEVYNKIYTEGYRDGYNGQARKIKDRDAAEIYDRAYEIGRKELLIESGVYKPKEHQRARELAKYKRKRDDENEYADYNLYLMLNEEKGFKEKEGEAAKLQALIKTISERAEEFVSSEAIPEDSKAVVLNNIIRDISEACKGNIPEEALEIPDLSAIPLWQDREQSGMPLDFIETHYGQWLPAFKARFEGKQEVFQDQIRAHDHRLMQGLRNQLYEEGKGRKVSDFIKTRSARVDRELKNTEYHKKVHREASRLNMAARRRKPKA